LVQFQHTAHHNTTIAVTYSQLSHNAREIVARFTLATSQEVQLGTDWYPSAYKIAVRLAGKYRIPTETAAGVIAALSPSNRWERNIVDAEALIKVFKAGATRDEVLHPKHPIIKVCTYLGQKTKAWDILHRFDPPMEEWQEITQILKGVKTIEFFNCITNPKLDDVCIDGHAYSVWLGQRVTLKDVPNLTGKIRTTIKQDYRDACAFINEELHASYSAADIQAITWVTHKRIHNV
tara:strand:+ start:6925 stop:7629 length:705 start_codon:yes stop_codon:yes gene_type:complete